MNITHGDLMGLCKGNAGESASEEQGVRNTGKSGPDGAQPLTSPQPGN